MTAHAAHLELTSAALGNIVSGRQMQQLPIVGRNPYALVTLAPGVVDRGNTGTGPLINGARSNSTAVMLDGAEQRNSTTNDLNYSPPLESVEEFKVATNGLSAEFGRTGGGVITVATRSGTNTLHGSAYAYVRNDRFNANSWTNNRNNVAKGKEDIKQYRLHGRRPHLEEPHILFRERRAIEQRVAGRPHTNRAHRSTTGG